MACGSVAQSEGAISLASLNLTRCDLTSSQASSDKSDSNSSWSRRSVCRGDNVHEAILFLQKEHEEVLTGLHQQVKQLQQKCDDLQFDVHLKHVISNEEETLKKKVSELNSALKERTQQLAISDQQLEEQQRTLEEEREQFRWKELKLQQQLEASDQRTAELKGEVSRLKSQVHDLKVFSSALRTSSSGPSSGGGGGAAAAAAQRLWTASKAPLSSTKPSLSTQRTSQESLESLGPRSLGSEEGDVGMWREARLGSGGGKLGSLRGTSRPQSGSLPPLARPGGSPRPPSVSSVLTLPPISKDKSGGVRPHVRRQLRLLSAPNLDVPLKSPRQPP